MKKYRMFPYGDSETNDISQAVEKPFRILNVWFWNARWTEVKMQEDEFFWFSRRIQLR